MFGQTVECLWVTGLIITCMVTESTLGKMVAAMKVTIIMTRSMDLGSTHGQMVVSTMACGRMESSMERVSTSYPLVCSEEVSGVKVIARSGSMLQVKGLRQREIQLQIRVETCPTLPKEPP